MVNGIFIVHGLRQSMERELRGSGRLWACAGVDVAWKMGGSWCYTSDFSEAYRGQACICRAGALRKYHCALLVESFSDSYQIM